MDKVDLTAVECLLEQPAVDVGEARRLRVQRGAALGVLRI